MRCLPNIPHIFPHPPRILPSPCYPGEIVTIESFLNWKKKFNSEMENANKKQIKGTVKENKKLTGEIFLVLIKLQIVFSI